jgi:predicted  nucleic acid-binding Zn-ribbon protein
MKVKNLFTEGKEERFGIKTTTADGVRYVYFKTRDEMERYIKKIREKLGGQLKSLVKLEKDHSGSYGAIREEVESIENDIKDLQNRIKNNGKLLLTVDQNQFPEEEREDLKHEIIRWRMEIERLQNKLKKDIREEIEMKTKAPFGDNSTYMKSEEHRKKMEKIENIRVQIKKLREKLKTVSYMQRKSVKDEIERLDKEMINLFH